MATNTLEETVASAKDLPPEQAISKLRDVILGKHPNDAESIKAKEQVPLLLLISLVNETLASHRLYRMHLKSWGLKLVHCCTYACVTPVLHMTTPS